MVAVTKQYQAYVTGALPGLIAQTTALAARRRRGGDLAKARADWLTAHLSYERLGAAYGAFGDADGAINGTADGLPDGVTDDGFTGFHRLEYGLWNGQAAATLVPIAQQLITDVSRPAGRPSPRPRSTHSNCPSAPTRSPRTPCSSS